MAFRSDTMYSVFALDTFIKFHASFLLSFPPLLKYQLQHVFLPCSQHRTIREHHLPRGFFSNVFRQWIHHDGKQERVESKSLVEANFHCKWFACSCSKTSLQFRIDGGPTYPSPVWCTSLAPPCLACTNTVLPSELCRRLFPDQWIHSVSLAVLLCIFLAAIS